MTPDQIAGDIIRRFRAGRPKLDIPVDAAADLQTAIATALGYYQNAAGVLAKLKPGEPFFLVRGQDTLAAGTVEWWAIHAKMEGVNGDKVNGAYAIAEDMLVWPNQKQAD